MMVGTVIFEDVNGVEIARQTYTKHPALRSPELFFRGLWYLQSRQDTGGWVYRAVSDVPGAVVSDPALKDLD